MKLGRQRNYHKGQAAIRHYANHRKLSDSLRLKLYRVHIPMSGGQGQVMVVCGGWDGDRALESVEMFSPRTGQWTPLPNMMGQTPTQI